MRKLDKETKQEIITRYVDCKDTMREIAKDMGISLGSVHKYLKEEKVPAREMWPSGKKED